VVGVRRRGSSGQRLVTKLVLFAALAASLLVPAGGVALAIAVATAPPPRYDADDPRPPNQFDRANLEAIYVELVALDRTGTPGSPGHIAAVRGIARDARA
jgi:hypothetical protein